MLKRAISIGVDIILLLIIVVMVDAWLTRNSAHGTPPPLERHTISGHPFSISGMKGEVSLLHFWGTWCPVCNLEHGTIDSLNRDYKMMTVALQSGSDEEIKQFLQQKGVNYPVLNDDSGEISSQFGVSSVPVTFVLNREGDISYVTRGYSSELGLRFRLWLASL
ncbi:MAG: protein disulfide oxidoreductase [Gammaproteobacteria bacterium]|nr:protein disulfide oxidoreductase [Gammaproteobacteria bacterium]